MNGSVAPGSAPVLVVDDEAGPRRLIAASLDAAGFEVVEAEGGDHALRLLAFQEFAAVVLDRTMPGLDGIEVLRWIRRTPAIALTPVIIVTGMDEVEDVVEGLGGGADDYVLKPFEPDELVARVQAQLRGRSGWAALVAQEVERRNALTDAARAAGAAGPIEQAALQLCEGLLSLPGASGVAVLEVVGEGVVTLAAKGDDPLALLGPNDAAGARGRRLVRRSRQGAWLEPAVDEPTGAATSVAVAPVSVDDEPVGLVVAAADPSVSRSTFDQVLAVTIDFAALASGVFGRELQASANRDSARSRFLRLAERHEFVTVFQPVVDLVDDTVVGYEALTRFAGEDSTEEVFCNAASVGAGTTVELRTLEAAIAESSALPEHAWLSLNVTPSLVMGGDDLGDRLRGVGRPTVLELSELEPVADYDALRAAITELGSRVQLSVDDAGSGFAGLTHILTLGAQYVKVDRSWIKGIDRDPARRALVAGLQNFAVETDAEIIAEGIETPEELETVRRLGIRFGQGFLLGPPHAL
jgi:EAL domain-containing protein (putative c-di-GMP-specific phosphodiesterase class I)/DNA-binding response OmpR family regulator